MFRVMALLGLAVLVRTAAGQSSRLDVPTWRARETLRLGSLNEPATTFGRISAAMLDSAGRIYVLDALSQNVRIFSPEGRLERTLGRRGNGPGEFERPFRMGFVGRQLWISDGASQRLVFFDMAGHADSTSRPDYRPPAGLNIDAPLALAADGGVIIIPSIPGDRLASGQSVAVPIVRLSPDGRLDTLHVVQRGGIGVRIEIGTNQLFLRRPLVWTPVVATASDAGLLAIAEQRAGRDESSPEFRLIVKDGVGRVTGDRPTRYDPVRVPRAWRDSVVDRYVTALKTRVQNSDLLARRIAAGFEIPAMFPPVERVVVGNDRTVWLRLAGAAPSARWLVYDAQAKPLGAVELPANLDIVFAGPRDVLAVGSLDNEVPIVVRYTITR